MKKILLSILMLGITSICSAKWIETDKLLLPSNTTIYQETNDKGKVKYYICVTDGTNKYNINVNKYNINKQLYLVYWKDENGNVRITTQVKKDTKAKYPNVELSKLKVVTK